MKKFVGYIVTTAVCVVIALAVVFWRGILDARSVNDVMRCLSDAFFVSGVLALASGGLVLAGNNGILDAFIYTVRRIFISLRSKEYRDAHKMTYQEYKDKKKKNPKPIAFLFVVGGVFVAIGVLFTVLFYCIK